MSEPKKKRGRPKLDWGLFHDQLEHRLSSGIAKKTVEAEAKELAKWAKEQGIHLPEGAPLGHARIRERIKRRYNGSAGYKATRLWKMQQGKSGSEPN